MHVNFKEGEVPLAASGSGSRWFCLGMIVLWDICRAQYLFHDLRQGFLKSVLEVAHC